jgi:hypothetical protein
MTHQNPAPFDITPEEIILRMRNYWLDSIEKGSPQFIESVLPYLEMRAVEKLEQELEISRGEAPDRLASIEAWRGWWLNEVEHNCDNSAPIRRAGEHLSAVAQAAVHVLVLGSELRDAIELKKAEKSAALAMLLMCEIMQGGLFTAYEKAHETQKKRHAKGIGSEAKDMAVLKKAAVDFAQKEWQFNPEKRIGEVADEFLIKAKPLARQLPNLMAWPKPLTVKTWIRNGVTDIPRGAQRRGRPPSLKS